MEEDYKINEPVYCLPAVWEQTAARMTETGQEQRVCHISLVCSPDEYRVLQNLIDNKMTATIKFV